MFYAENKLVLFTMKDLLLYFHSWGGSWKGEGGERGEGEKHMCPNPDELPTVTKWSVTNPTEVPNVSIL